MLPNSQDNKGHSSYHTGWLPIFHGLMARYQLGVTDYRRVLAALHNIPGFKEGYTIEADHIAFRTFGMPHLGIAAFEKLFLNHGYRRKDRYQFPLKHLTAYWYAPPTPDLPRIFLSELQLDELSPQIQQRLAAFTESTAVRSLELVDAIDFASPEAIEQFFLSKMWRQPTQYEYETIAEESEYAAWVLLHGYALNHYAISVDNFPDHLHTIEKINAFVESEGLILNDSGGKIKVSDDTLLLQSSSVAALHEHVFADGKRSKVPGAYVEFVERRILPEYAHLPVQEIQLQHRRDGFEADNADKIFESTYSHQTHAA